MKKIAIFQSDLKVGGIQKALLNILNTIDYERYAVDVYLFDDVHFFKLPVHKNLNFIYNRSYLGISRILYFRWILKFAKSVTHDKVYDIAIDFSSYRNECAVGVIKTQAKKRIMWIHNDVEIKRANDFKYKVLWHFFKGKLRHYDSFAAVSPGIIDGFRRVTGIYDKTIVPIPNHIDTQEIFAKADEPIDFTIDEQYYNVCTMGRMISQKGFDILLDELAETVKTRQDIRLYLIGDGPDRSKLERQIARLGLTDTVFLLGNKQNPFPYMKKMDAFVLTSRYEGQGIVIWEAKTLGLALFITKNLEKYNPGIAGTTHIAQALATAKPREKLPDDLTSYNDEIKAALESLLVVTDDRPTTTYDIMLCGYYGFDNSGDEALLKSVIQSIRQHKPDTRFLVLSKKPKQTMLTHGVASINRYNLLKINQKMKQAKVFVYGGGSIIQDSTSTRSLVYYTKLLDMAKKQGLKLMIYGNGIGPIHKKANVKRSKKALAMCDYISLRESHSLEEMKRLGLDTTHAHVTVDPAFVITPTQDSLPWLDENKAYFAINLRSWKHNEPQFVTKIAKTVADVYKERGLIPVYIPMHPNDYQIIREVIKEAKTNHVLLPDVHDVSVTMAVIKKTQFVMSMRLHTLVYAVSVGVPVVGLSYDPKIDFFMEYVGQPIYVKTSAIDEQKLAELIDYIFDHHETICISIKDRATELKRLSEKDAKAAINLL